MPISIHSYRRRRAVACLIFLAGFLTGLILVRGDDDGGPEHHLATTLEYWRPDDPDRRDIDMVALTAEYQLRFRHELLRPFSVGASASLVQANGTVILDDGPDAVALDSDTTGASLALSWRVHGFENARTAMWFDLSGGVLWTADDFPTGGSDLNGIFRSGIGFSHRMNEALSLVGGLRYGHVSNGSGLGAQNPAYDALTGYLGVRVALDREDSTDDEHDPAAPWPARTTRAARGSVEMEYFHSVHEAHREVAMYAMSAVSEYRVPAVPALGVTVSGTFYYVAGHDHVPTTGMGMFNAGSVGQSIDLGLRLYPWRGERLSWFIEARAGAVVAGHFTRAWPFPPEGEDHAFVDPRTWSLAARLGTGLEWSLSEDLSVSFGYRRLHLDNYDHASTPDYAGDGFFLGLGQRF